MPSWPTIAEPELLERLALDDREFEEFVRTLVSRVPPREFDAGVLARAIGYPWVRPAGSFRLTDGAVERLAEMSAGERERAIHELSSVDSGRVPVLAFGSNAAPETLELKFAHFSNKDDRTVLALTGRLHDFDVGVSPQPALYGAMPATLFPSPGTAAGATVLWVTPTQFTQLTWSELSYRLGKLRTRFEADEGSMDFDEVLVFVSRFGVFCVDRKPVALAAIPASGRTASALTQEQMLDAVAALAIGPGATAETLVRAIFEDMGQIAPRIAAAAWGESQPFASERWAPFDPSRNSR